MNKFEADVLLGKYGNMYFVDSRGHNPDIDTGVAEDVWEAGGLLTARPLITDTTGKEIEVVSDSVNDTSDGTGARTIRITYLDGLGFQQRATITLNGTTPVATGILGWRVSFVEVMTAGSGNKNAGNITIRFVAPDNAVVLNYVRAESSVSATCLYTIPKGKRGTIFNYGMSLTDAGNTYAEFSLMLGKPNGIEIRGCYCAATKTARSDVDLHNFVIPELTDVWVRVTNVSSNNASIQAWVKVLVDEA